MYLIQYIGKNRFLNLYFKLQEKTNLFSNLITFYIQVTEFKLMKK